MGKKIDDFWIERVLTVRIFPKHLSNLMRIFIVFFLPVIIIYYNFLIERLRIIMELTIYELMCVLLASSWILFGPLLIHRFASDIKLFARSEAYKYVGNKLTEECIMDYFSSINRIVSPTWVLSISSVLWITFDELVRYGFFSRSDPYFIISIVFISFMAYLTSIGFTFSLVIIKLVIDFTREDRKIENAVRNLDICFFDKIGEVSYTVSKYLVSGCLYLPLLIEHSTHFSNIYRGLVYLLIFVYFAFLLTSFFLPNILLARKSSKVKSTLLMEKKLELESCKNKIICKEYIDISQVNTMQLCNLCLSNKLTLFSEFEKYDFHPIQQKQVFTLVSTIILPAVLTTMSFISFLREVGLSLY